MNGNLFARLTDGLPADRRGVFLETGAGEEWSFARLLDMTGRMAMLLRASGVAPGDRVAAQAGATPEAACLYLACLQAGAVYAPLDPGCVPLDLARMIAHAEPRVVVCDPETEGALAGVARAVGAAIYSLAADGTGRLTAEAMGLPSDRTVAARRGGDLAAIFYGPGAAGRPLGAMATHDNLWMNAATLHWLWGLRPGEVMLHALPLDRAPGLFVALNLMLMNGGRIILPPEFEAERIRALLPRAALLMGAPAVYAGLATLGLAPGSCAGVRLFISGAAPMPSAVHAAFEAQTGRRALECWGSAETGIVAAAAPADERRPGAVGRPLPGMTLRPAGGDEGAASGVVEMRGPSIGPGYWRDPAATAQRFREDGWFVAGDRVAIAPDGQLTVLGREPGSGAPAWGSETPGSDPVAHPGFVEEDADAAPAVRLRSSA